MQGTKEEHWIGLEGLDESSVWDTSRLVTGPALDGGRSRVLTLQIRDPATKRVVREIINNADKGVEFFRIFFLPKPDVSTVPQDTAYLPPAWEFQPIMDNQIHWAIQRMKPYKATCPQTVPNCVYTFCRELLVQHLGPIFQATDTLKTYPAAWKLTEVVALCKPGKADYAVPGAWQPVMLSSRHA
jgi:hypothetical protein